MVIIMLRKIESKNMGKSDLGWLQSIFHFSFADYQNPNNINFGVLRVLNDDIILPGEGFDLHPHKDMEIISYVVDGSLSHGDSMGNERTLTRGQVQYMSAGTGVFHREHNYGDKDLRLLQMWIFPDKRDYTPDYGDYKFTLEDRHNKWLLVASSKNSDAPIKINQDANIYVIELDKGKEVNFDIKPGRQGYLVQIEGNATINGLDMDARDSLEIVEESITIKADETSHVMLIEMRKGM